MLRFKSLGSGSTGNATLIEAGGQPAFRLLVDCGLGLRQLSLRLAQAGLTEGDIDAIFITHEHSDHIGCARQLARRHGIPVWMSHGTYTALDSPDFEGWLRTAQDGVAIDLGGLQLTPFTVPHDAREPLQLTCTDGAVKLGILTDLGHATAHVLAHLQQCDALLLESNHDSDLLAASSYPSFLKRRVSGQFGHLSNAAAAQIAQTVSHPGLKHLVAAHLSQQNNRSDLVQDLLSQALGCSRADIVVADASSGTPWLAL
ncbi:MBL fold metallo-hydrolase [Polaromonas sp. SM01]|uniref:MBL fold metallo-hydrolase n=1 Tax=Polaromonas sp. SM01 TaxID=3085630 RepID=UPI00298240B1|nr:MBL fold metallo-hydrolase [Polaromonas sp. SM01]MDW5442976.1 MBL fold metallo-hydrolase [Polaromonas sp. SM01]